MFTGDDNAVTEAELERYAQSATQTFLAAYARRPRASRQRSPTTSSGSNPTDAAFGFRSSETLDQWQAQLRSTSGTETRPCSAGGSTDDEARP